MIRLRMREEINSAFTAYSRPDAMVLSGAGWTPVNGTTGTTEMAVWNHIVSCASTIREFVAPTYRPERHYMRGPGPACARRTRRMEVGFAR